MVIDSSALLAVLLDEPERPAFRAAIDADATRLASAATLLESSIVLLARFGEPGVAESGALVRAADIEAAPFGAGQMEVALDAFRRVGKGRHPAGLNFGDCFSTDAQRGAIHVKSALARRQCARYT